MASTSTLRTVASSSLRTLSSNLSPHRYAEHYHRVLAPDLLYMTYDPALSPSLSLDPSLKKASQLAWDPANPYTKNRPSRAPRGGRPLTPATHRVNPQNVVQLREVVLNCFVKEAAASKSQILSAVAAFQAITGEPIPGYAADGSSSSKEGIQIVKTGKGSASFKVRSGMVCGVKVHLQGEAMWSFLETLVDLVLPRLKDWNGVKLPPPSVNRHSPSSTGGVVSFGLPAQAMGLFPSIEVNLENYPRLHGFNIQFITNARGVGAQDQARALVSGFRVPFVAA